MSETTNPGHVARRGLLRLAAGLGALAATTTTRADEAAAVKIDNFTFKPATLRIKAGTEVTWTNEDDIPHSIVLTALGVRSKAMDTDATYAYRFMKPGTFNYICGLHPHMKGQIVVSA
jgi:plastocyanin